jgi:hypothetical protein
MRRALLPILLLASACRSFDFERQEVYLRYRPDADVLDVVLAYQGVGATQDEEAVVAGTTATLQDIARGQRHFIVWDWPFDFDLDSIVEELQRKPRDPGDEYAGFQSALLEYQTHVEMTAARFLRDADGRLCLLQRLRCERGARLLQVLDLGLNAWVLEESGEDEPEITADVRTDALFLARARRGGSWARFDGLELEVSIPMTPEQAALQLERLVARTAASAPSEEALERLFEPLLALSVTGEELRLRFAPAADGWIRFTLPPDGERGYRPAVAERMGAALELPRGDLAAEVQRLKALP